MLVPDLTPRCAIPAQSAVGSLGRGVCDGMGAVECVHQPLGKRSLGVRHMDDGSAHER